MANGGWYGTEEEWREAEAPLLPLDERVDRFAVEHGFTLTRNHKDWPERSLTKDGRLECLIQIWRAELETDEWNVGAVCSEDRGRKRYWKRKRLADRITAEQLGASLDTLLAEGLELVTAWSSNPDSLEFATKLSRLP